MTAGVVAAGLFGLVAALPALRLRADYLAIVTIALAEIVRLTFTSSTFKSLELFGKKLGTGGGRGLLRNFPDPLTVYVFNTDAFRGFVTVVNDLLGARTTYKPILEDLVVSIVILLFVAGFYWLLERTGGSPFGRVLKAIREDEDVARALGKNTNRFKIKSFMLGCALMGLAGMLWVYYGLGQLNPLAYRPQWTFYVWVALIIGGAGSNTGSVMGSALFVSVLFRGPRYLRDVIRNLERTSELVNIGVPPTTFAGAVGPLLSLDPTPLIAYMFGNMNPFRIVLLGVILVWLMKRRPEGILGHRTESAASIPLSSQHARTVADGGEEG
jgi:branched-chain amino acid transport system permease protein